jgi:hypothetical protein
MITNDTRCIREIKSRISIAKVAFNKKAPSSANGLKVKEGTSKVLHLQYALNGAETWTLQKVGQKCLESFEKL